MREKAVGVAVSEMRQNVREVGSEDRGPFIDRYATNARSGLSLREGVAGREWCGMFIFWCYTEAARSCSVRLPILATDIWSGQRLFHWAQHNRSTIVSGDVRPGDIYVAQSNHIGMVIAAMPDPQTFKSIDGNQSFVNSGRNAITENTRNVSGCRVLVRF
jgi:hypothetical protein